MRARCLTALSTLPLLLLGLAWLAPPAFAAPTAKVQLCHIPPGNPDGFHTITISASALSAHLAHGDLGGACDENCQALCDEDGDVCTIAECDPSGGCAPADPVDCDDRNLCTTDSCDPDLGCGNTPVECNAPDRCTVSMCARDTGECVDSPLACPDGQRCNPDNGLCEGGGPLCDELGESLNACFATAAGQCDATDLCGVPCDLALGPDRACLPDSAAFDECIACINDTGFAAACGCN